MSDTPTARGASLALATALLVLLAVAGAVALAALLVPGAVEAAVDVVARARAGDVAGAFSAAAAAGLLPWLGIPLLGPLLVALLLALFGRGRAGARDAGTVGEADAEPRARGRGAASAPEAKAPARPSPPSPAVGLRLLAALQEDARLLDFVREEIADYSDEQIGSATRGIHAALRKAIDARVSIAPILAGEDGDAVEVPAGFDPALVRVTGKPTGAPPYRGVLRHGGWKASEARLPLPTEGSDPTILMPAEVEVE
jgi:hypothetical protein